MDWKDTSGFIPKKELGRTVFNRKRRNYLLHRFMTFFNTLDSREQRIAALREISFLKFDVSTDRAARPTRIRNRFNEKKNRYYGLRGACVVCGQLADVRHHLVQIQNGGGNASDNLVRLCNSCHEEVHPWLKEDR